MNKFGRFINPIERLGMKKYSIIFPLLVNLAVVALSEFFAYNVVKNPDVVGVYIIFINVALIMYFSFRDGIRGGFIASAVSLLYYFYIIYTRHYGGSQLTSVIQTTLMLGALYFFLASIIGWLKQTIDTLIDSEADERRRLQAIVQQLPVGVLVADKNGKILQANKQVETLLGRKMRESLISGKDTVSNTLENKSVNLTQWPINHTLSTGKPVVGKNYTIERDDKKKVYLQISATPIHNKEGKVIAAASIINDITAQREMEDRKDDFVNMASHELKTPITSMKLYIDSLINRIKQTKDEKALKTLTSIKYQTERLQELVSDLLDVSRLQTGKLSFNKEKFQIDELIEETIEGLQGSTTQHAIKFSKKSPVTVFADKFRVYQVLTNLITNAIKYSPDASEINVAVKKDGQKAIVSVKDSGIGIDKDQQRKIFDRLYQVTDSKEKTFPGLGMGLYISKEIIKRHKGTIWTESIKGKGSTFFFSLPSLKK